MNKRQRKKRNKSHLLATEPQSMIGAIIDMPLAEFEEQLIKQKTNLGTMNNLIMYLTAIYGDLKQRKDGVLDLVFKKGYSKDDPQIKKSLEGLYAELTKVEQKVVFLKQRYSELISLGSTDEV